MTKFLDHARMITDHRDGALVDVAMLNSLVDLLGAEGVHLVLKLYRIVEIADRQITLTAWTDGQLVLNDEIECDASSIPDVMTQALAQQRICAESVTDAQNHVLFFTWFPVVRNKELLGCIEVGASQAMEQGQSALINGMCGLYANYLSLLHYSQIDTLTQLLNRKTFDESLLKILADVPTERTELARAVEQRGSLAGGCNWLAVMDIDHFKRINDNFGHLFGDEVLILIASLIRQGFRSKDKLFRFGGEEFVILLRNASEHDAFAALERLRKSVEHHVFPQLGNITISIGFTKMRSADTSASLIGRADEALYYAKHNGRNQLRFFDKLAAEGEIVNSAVLHSTADLF